MEDLTIGIISSFGCLFLIGMFAVLRLWLCPRFCKFRDRDSEGIMRLELSPKAYDDLMKGCLTTTLHREIVHLYALKGDLSAYKEHAKRQRHVYLIEFLKDPNRHPMVIHNVLNTPHCAVNIEV